MDGETRVDPNAGWSTLKEIPLDATEFTANGKTFRVYKSVSQDRWAEYETLTDEIGFARTFDQIRNEVKGCIDILDSITKNGKGFVDLSVKLNDLYTGTHLVGERQTHPVLRLCSLFIIREGEDVRFVDEQVIESKIEDWRMGGIDMKYFFQFALSSIPGFYEAYRSTVRATSKPEGMKENRATASLSSSVS